MADELVLDMAGAHTEDDFHDRASQAFNFPNYYGRNRDAFGDCITDIASPTKVRILNLASLDTKARHLVEPYIGMLKEYEKQTGGQFAVAV
jgi:RNAse (barnase) inhibitor barstar